MLGGTSVFDDNTVREISRERRPRGSAGVGDDLDEPVGDDSDGAAPPVSPENGLPDGYTLDHRTTAGKGVRSSLEEESPV